MVAGYVRYRILRRVISTYVKVVQAEDGSENEMQNHTQRLKESDRARPLFYGGAGINKQENEIFLTKKCAS